MTASIWQRYAACRTHSPDLFLDDTTETEALAICSSCPARRGCLNAELDLMRAGALSAGVRGATTLDQREAMIADAQQQIPLDDPQHDTIEHGTDAGYKAHRRNGTDTCPACREAHARDQAHWRTAHRDEVNEQRRCRTWSKNWLAQLRAAAHTESMRLRDEISYQHLEAS